MVSSLRNMHRGSGTSVPRVVVYVMPEPYPTDTYGHLMDVNLPGELKGIFTPFSSGQKRRGVLPLSQGYLVHELHKTLN